MIDTAEGYGRGNSEIQLGKTLKELGVDRKKLVIVTKTHNRDPKTWRERLQASLQRMQIDYVDLYYMHGLGDAGDSDPGVHNSEAVREAVADLKNRGMMKHFGFSSHCGSPDFMHDLCAKAAEGGHVEVCMLKYNFRDYQNEKFSADLDVLTKAGIGVVAMKTQGGASAAPDRVKPFISEDFNQYQAAVRWALADQRISTVCSAMRNVDQVKENAAAAKSPMMSRSELQSLYMYALATHGDFCQLCDECTKVCPAHVAIPSIMRYQMYAENYAMPEVGFEHYLALESTQRANACVGGTCDLCEAACPYDVRIRSRLKRAREVFA
ncbi:aldo/keto reductase [bacterium]|nr:aldo/keto reductase [bacterium]